MEIVPGAGLGEATCRHVVSALTAGKPLVLDADALTAFSENPSTLFAGLSGSEILTPHEGEFARLFSGVFNQRVDFTRAIVEELQPFLEQAGNLRERPTLLPRCRHGPAL